MRSLIKLILCVCLSMATLGSSAQQIVRKSEVASTRKDSVKMVVVNGDTTAMILPERNFGRFDRGLFNYIFIPKGKWGFGLTASYGELSTEESQILSLLNNVTLKGKQYSIKPYISCFFKHNQSLGLRFNYTRGIADLSNLALDFGDDLNFSLHDISYYQQSLTVSAFYRTYVGLDGSGRFGLFSDVDLGFGSGSSRFKRPFNGEMKDTRTLVTQGTLNFSPGVCVFLQEYVSFNLSFGVFGLNWRKEDQSTNGVDEGSRITSGANFRFNIFNINFGLMVVI